MTAAPVPLRTKRPRFPFPRYPTGWFQVAWSSDLEPGGVVPLKYFGKDLVAFRTESGGAKVLDAFCPHMGAHLGHGGVVHGETLECPFHAWKFDGEGNCTEVPYAKRIPPKAKVECWPSLELNGAVWVWHDVDGRAPLWELPTLEEFSGSDDWADAVHRDWKLRTHNQEMAENICDSAHFKYLHGTLNQPDTKVEFDGHRIHMVSNTDMGTGRGEVKGQVESNSWGFGFSTTRFTGLVHTLLIGAVTPIDDDYVHVRFSFTVKKVGDADITRGVGKAFVAEVSRQLEQDAPVWEHKVFLDRPLLCDGDGPIAKLRRWGLQFYPEWYLEQAREAYYDSRAAE